jgi:hypothetical protein
MLLDNLIMQGLKKLFPVKHKITGKCRQCGNCCQGIYLKMSEGQKRSRLFVDVCVRWLSWLYDFYLIKIDYENNYLIFSCKHKGQNGSCRNYFWRPPVCRNYPLQDYFKETVFLPGCGFRSE